MELPIPVTAPDCSRCSLNIGPTLRPVWGSGPLNGYLVVLESPTVEDIRANELCNDTAGMLLKKCIEEAGIPLDQCRFTSLTLCRPPGGREASSFEVSCCSSRFNTELDYVNPHTLILVGMGPVKAVFGDKALGKNYRGKVAEFKGIKTTALYSPRAVLRDPSKLTELVDQLKAVATEQEPFNPVTYSEVSLDQIPWSEYDGNYASLDIETTSLEPERGVIVATGISFNGDHVYIVWEDANLVALEANARGVKLLCHNAQFESSWFLRHSNLHLMGESPFTEDTMLMAHALYMGVRKDFSLKTLGTQEFQIIDWSLPIKPYITSMGSCPPDLLNKYLAYDVAVTHRLGTRYQERLKGTPMESAYYKYVSPSIQSLSTMSSTGIYIDQRKLIDIKYEWVIEIQEQEERIAQLTSGGIQNLNSHPQLAHYLYGVLKLRGDKGSTSCDSDALEYLEAQYPEHSELLSLIRDTRKQRHLLANFVNKLLSGVGEDSRVRASFNLHRTDTGRLSSSGVINLQNIPARGTGSKIRRAFVPDPGYKFLELDYKALEVRVTAYYTRDATLIEYLNSGRDIHRELASKFFNVPLEEVTDFQRSLAKEGVFGTLYGGSEWLLVRSFGIPVEQARGIRSLLFETYPGIREFSSLQHKLAQEVGYCRSVTGRTRFFPIRTNENLVEIKRQSVNTPIQSMASDICLESYNLIFKEFIEGNPEPLVKPGLLVHDSILVQVREEPEYFNLISERIKEIMETDRYNSPVKFLVDMKSGYSWDKGDLT